MLKHCGNSYPVIELEYNRLCLNWCGTAKLCRMHRRLSVPLSQWLGSRGGDKWTWCGVSGFDRVQWESVGGDSKILTDLGTPTDVGYRLSKNAIAPPDSGCQAELVNAEELRSSDRTYYLLEYAVTLSNQQQRHVLASVGQARSHGQLYRWNLFSTERRWHKGKSMFEQVVKSFRVY